MKKFFISILSLICIVFGAAGLSACASGGGTGGGSGGSGNNNVAIEKQYNENIKYKLSYTSEEECPNGNINDEYLHTRIDVEENEVYYMVADFTISNFELDGWGNSFNAAIKISPATVIDATLEEAKTGNFTEIEEDDSKIITLTYSIPEYRTEGQTYRATIRLNLLTQQDIIKVGVAFYGDNQGDYTFSEFDVVVKATEGLEYTKSTDGRSYSVTGIGAATDSHIIIADYYEDLPVTSIGDWAFYNCSSFTSITIPDSVTSIGISAFQNCTSFTSIIMPDSVTTIGDSAFQSCSSFTSITIPDSVISIGDYAFRHCEKLASITISDGVISIGSDAFYDCTSLESITVQAGNTVYHSAGNCIIETKSKTLIAGCKNSIIPADGSVTSIGSSAFYNCKSLTSITIPDSVTSIDSGAFSYCTSLTSIEIPDSVTSIGARTFNGCAGLKSITIPDSVTLIGQYAFSNCTNLTSVVFKNTTDWKLISPYNGHVQSPILPLKTVLPDTSRAAKWLRDTYAYYIWQCG